MAGTGPRRGRLKPGGRPGGHRGGAGAGAKAAGPPRASALPSPPPLPPTPSPSAPLPRRRAPPLPGYAELHCRSNFSFLAGASHPEELVQRAHALRYAALALTDEGSLAGVVRAHGRAQELGLPLIVGAEMQLQPPTAGKAAGGGAALPSVATGAGPAARAAAADAGRAAADAATEAARERAAAGSVALSTAAALAAAAIAQAAAAARGGRSAGAAPPPSAAPAGPAAPVPAAPFPAPSPAPTAKPAAGASASPPQPPPAPHAAPPAAGPPAQPLARPPAGPPAAPPAGAWPRPPAAHGQPHAPPSGATEPPAGPAAAAADGRPWPAGAPGPRLLLLAMSRRGYGNLSQWITVARRRAGKGRYQALMADLEGRVPQLPMLAGLPDCLALLHTPSALASPQPFETLLAQALWLKTWFGAARLAPDGGPAPAPDRSAAAVTAEDSAADGDEGQGAALAAAFAADGRTAPVIEDGRAALALPLLRHAHDAVLVDLVQRVSALTGLPIVAVGSVAMHTRSRKPLLDLLTATRLRRTVAQAGAALQPNAEAHLRPRARLAALYRPEWLAASVTLAARCAFSLAELRYEYPQEIVPAGHTPASWLRALTEQGAARRYPAGVPPAVRTTLEHELALIGRLRYEPYFLTVADLVHWARGQGILCQGRGSAANSAVCYCLGVTEVDPARMSLLFERFVSAERNEPPDIDIDFEHQRREEVIQYVYRKYGRHRAALTAVVISYRPRSALRDVGRALGFDLDRIDAVSKGQQWWDGSAPPGPDGRRRRVDPERLREHGFDPESPLCRLWMELTEQLVGFPRHLSQHPGGFVIARDELARLVPVENAAMADRSVIQWDKDDLDTLGLIKVDLLALGMLSAIRRALQWVGEKVGRMNPAPPFQMQAVPAEDPATYAMLCRGDSVGVFQVESRAQMSMLPRLRPERFYDLVIEVAIVRPGPIQGGMVHPYLRRRSGEEAVDYPSAEVKQALERTLGVPIFQEQVMQLAILAADFSPGEADALRRAMAAWKRKGGLGPFHERLVGRMVAKGYAQEYAERIFQQIQGFGEYGFPESHAASFALLVYVSAWLKCHHPDAFLAALLDSQPMGFYAPAQLVRDAREHGVAVRPVCVLRSGWTSALEPPGQRPDAARGDAGDAAHDEARGAPAGTAGGEATGPGVVDEIGEVGEIAEIGVAGQGMRPWPVRLGLNRVSGLSEAAAQRLLAARAERPFADVEDLARRAALDARELSLLAQADALRGLAGHRHRAAWAVAGIDTRATPLLAATRTQEPLAAAAPALPAPDAAQTTLADYRSTGLTLAQHPLALLRAELAAYRVLPAAVLQAYPSGRLARASGLVTHRQRPETAQGVVFVTLEDETGPVNVIVWPQVAQAQRRPLLAARLLTVYGVWQAQGAVRHLIARRLVDHTPLLQRLAAGGAPAAPGAPGAEEGGATGFRSRNFR